jgi:toxin ParE1/3/4
MNKKYKVEWAAVAENDLKQIINYIAVDRPDNALQLLKKIREKYPVFTRFRNAAELFPNCKLREYKSTGN